MDWWWWVLVGVLALAGESASMALFLLYVGVAAFVAALLSFLHVGAAAQIGVFIALSALLIVLVRPRMLQALTGRTRGRDLTNQGRLTGRTAVVTQTVTRDGGTVRVGNAEFWTARAREGQTIPVGSPVHIAYVEGLTVVVEALPAPDAASSAPDAARAP